jgi:hypothetical protein
MTYTYYEDTDGDGYGDDNASMTSSDCEPEEGWSVIGGDCNNEDDDVYPGATEICNEIDDDCDGDVDTNCIVPYEVTAECEDVETWSWVYWYQEDYPIGFELYGSAWFMSPWLDSAVILFTEDEDTCGVANDIAAGTYSGAAMLVQINDWSSYSSGNYDFLPVAEAFADGIPDIHLQTYYGGSTSEIQEIEGEIDFNNVDPGGMLEGWLYTNYYTTDGWNGEVWSEGFYACHCNDLDGFSLP